MPNILKDNTNKVLLLMSLPISLGMLSTFLFQVIDTYFIAELGANSLAALSFSSTIYFILISLYIGLSIGVSIIIGQSVGKGDFERVKKTTWVALLLSFSISVLLSTVSLLFINELFIGLGATTDVLPLTLEYIIPILIGMPLLTVGMTASGILRASGNVSKPEIVMAIAGIINLGFDYVFIFGKWGFPAFGIKGAAYATVISWGFVFIVMIGLLLKDKLIDFTQKASHSVVTIVQEIFKLAAPTILTQIIGPLTITFLTFLLAKESALAVAAFGVVSRMETLIMVGVLAVSTSITPFVAQNAGAKANKRIDEAIVFGGKTSLYLGLLMALLLFVFVKPMAAIFSDNEEVIAYICNYFYIVSFTYLFYALYVITTSIFNGLKKTMISLKITVIKSIVFAIPLTLIGSLWSVNGIFYGLAIANILAGIYALIAMRKEIKGQRTELHKISALEAYKNDIKWLFQRNKTKKQHH
ncbi:MAG: hypothetical protein COB60_08040 [Flavobacteriaceae bacterium]|nr:MAG: hypothetical protein COB60_08040 [Flavobacteriaceae bacterium]